MHGSMNIKLKKKYLYITDTVVWSIKLKTVVLALYKI